MSQRAGTGGNILEVSHVSNEYDDAGGIFSKPKKKRILRDVSFTVRADEFFGLVGESGCGKSTLANAILGQIPFDGTIRVGEMEYRKADRKAFTARVQAVFQDPMSALDPRRTIGYTMSEPLRAHGIGTKAERSAAVSGMLERVGLDPSYAGRYPRELSGGQRQRVCIGAALMLRPALVIADEAVSALDVSVGAQILNLFRKIDADRDFSMLFISHNLNVVHYLCDRIAVMYRGAIVEMGDAEDICAHPVHPYTEMLLAAVPELTSRIRDDETGASAENGKRHAEPEGKGEAPEDACGFYPRCPYASEACLRNPEMKALPGRNGEPHLVRCPVRTGV